MMSAGKPKLTLDQQEALFQEIGSYLRIAVETALDMLSKAGLADTRPFDVVLQLEGWTSDDYEAAVEDHLAEEEDAGQD